MIIIYTLPSCPTCKQLKEYFTRIGLEKDKDYKEIQPGNEDWPGEPELARMSGYDHFPIICTNGKYYDRTDYYRALIDECNENIKSLDNEIIELYKLL